MKSKLIGVIIFILMFTTLMPNFIYAVDEDTKFDINTQDFKTIQENYGEGKFNKLKDEGKADISASAGTKTKQIRETHSLGASLAGIVTTTLLYPVMIASMIITVTTRGNDAFFSDGRLINWFTIEDTVFGRIDMFDADFFTYDTNDVSFNGKIKSSVAVFYYIMKVIAVLAGLVMLIYVGIRMAISTVASEQAQYKKMLTDWLVSFALIFMLNYIIIFAIEVNNGFIGLLEGPVRTKIGSGITTSLVKQSLGIMATKSWGALMVYAMLIGMTAAFLFSYVKRMLTIGFLILISPLITITYSVDKIGDGKAQALNAWLKEFLFNVLIQPFHCIIYIVFASTAVDLLSTSGSLAKMVLAIMCMAFIWKAEKIVKEIFGFKSATSLAETVASFMVVKEVGKKLANGASKAGAAAGGIALKGTKFGQNISNKVGSSKLGTKYKDWKTNNPDVARKIEQIGSAYGNALKKAAPVAIGATASAFEAGANTPANSLDVGLQAGTIASKLINGDPTADGSKEKISAAEKNMEKAADNFARNSRFGCGNYRNDQNSKDRLKSYVQQLIGADMDTLNNNVQDALKDLMNADPTYNINTPEGMKHLNDLQDIALSQELDFHDPSTNPLGHRWTTQEMNAVSAIQLKNLATAVKGTHAQYQAAGRNNPSQDVDNFIENMK